MASNKGNQADKLKNSILDRNNQTIPRQVITTNTTTINATSSTLITPTATSSSSHSSGVSKGTVIGASVAIPIVVIAGVGSLLFWVFRRKKTRKRTEVPPQELGADPGMKELGGGAPVGREMDATEPKKELDAGVPPTELDAPHQQRLPIELE